jgi:hypothetical protein
VWPSLGVMVLSESGLRPSPAPSIIEGTTMEQYAGIDVSLESASVCVVDAAGRIVREAKLECEPEVLITWFSKLGVRMTASVRHGPHAMSLHLR